MEHRVLLVDDDHNLITSLKRILRNEPYEIALAFSGSEALEVMKSEPIDVIVSDQDMAGLRGTALLRIVREQYPETMRFMLTGKATLEVALQAINEGEITRFFQKPCNPIDLSVSIRQALVQRALLLKVKELFHVNFLQGEMIKSLEEKYPGISKIKRDNTGSVVLQNNQGTYGDFLQRISREYSTPVVDQGLEL